MQTNDPKENKNLEATKVIYELNKDVGITPSDSELCKNDNENSVELELISSTWARGDERSYQLLENRVELVSNDISTTLLVSAQGVVAINQTSVVRRRGRPRKQYSSVDSVSRHSSAQAVNDNSDEVRTTWIVAKWWGCIATMKKG